MILEIYSSYGKLVATPMTLQAIENSILGDETGTKKQEEDSTELVDYPTDQ